MGKTPRCAGFLIETFAIFAAVGRIKIGEQNRLDGNDTINLGIARLIDNTHGAAPDFGQHLVSTHEYLGVGCHRSVMEKDLFRIMGLVLEEGSLPYAPITSVTRPMRRTGRAVGAFGLSKGYAKTLSGTVVLLSGSGCFSSLAASSMRVRSPSASVRT